MPTKTKAQPGLATCFAWEEAQVGTVEHGGADGKSGNIIHYWEDIKRHDLEGKSWCGAVQDAMALATGLWMPGSMISTHVGAQAFADHGLWVPVNKGPMLPGDFVFYCWKGSKKIADIDHIGWGWKMLSRTTLEDFEGNTSGVGNSGQSQRNGGMFAKRVRSTEFVVGYGRPKYGTAKPVTVMSSNPYNFHDHPVYAAQWALGVKLTGRYDATTKQAIIAFKARHGYPKADAGVGPKTVALLSQVRHPRTV